MYILALETTGARGSVALINEKQNICGYKVSEDAMSHLKNLIPMTAELLEDAGVYKNTPEGKAAFLRFIDDFNQEV